MKKCLALIMSAVMLLSLTLFAACVNNNPLKYAELLKNVETVESASYKIDDEFLNKFNAFAAKFTAEYYDAYGEEETNMAISPLSVYMALALACECADGETRAQILTALDLTYEELKENTEILYKASNKTYYSYDNTSVDAEELITNSIWIDKSVDAQEDCVNTLADDYYCYSHRVDFVGENEKANEAIRQFIKEKTRDLIDQNFNLSDETLFAIINTVYLSDIWGEFDLKKTDKPYVFTTMDGNTESLNLLQGLYRSGKTYETEEFKAFYAQTEHDYKVKFFVPQEGYTLDEVFTAKNIQAVNEYSYSNNAYDEENKLHYNTRCLFPAFKAESEKRLKELLINKFGITDMFNSNADFSNFTDCEVVADSVIHKAILAVDEEGIEGAAVTIFTFMPTSAPISSYQKVYSDFVVDRAFGYIVSDSQGVPLFTGVVKNP